MHRIVLNREARKPQLPSYEQITHDAIREAAALWDAARAELNVRNRDVVELEQTREASEWLDAEAAEQARAEGKADPKRTNVQAHDRKLDSARHELKVAVLGEQRAYDGLQAALDEHQGDWLQATTDEVEALSKAYMAALSTLAELHRQLMRAHKMRALASNGDTNGDGENPLTSAIRVSPKDVSGLDFAPESEERWAPGYVSLSKRSGAVPVEHVLRELATMGRLPTPEVPEPEREMQTVNIMGHSRSIPKPLSSEEREARLARKAARHAQRDALRAAEDAAISEAS